jgi:hypothetical protein
MLNPLKSNISMRYIPHRCQVVSIRNTSQLICVSFRNQTEQRSAVCGQKAVLHVTHSNFMALEH